MNGYLVEQFVYIGVVVRNLEFLIQFEYYEWIFLYLFNIFDIMIYDVMCDCYFSEFVIKVLLKCLELQFEEYLLYLLLRGLLIYFDGNEIYFCNFLGSFVNIVMDVVVGQNDKVNRYLLDVRLGDIENVVVELLCDYYLEIDDI